MLETSALLSMHRNPASFRMIRIIASFKVLDLIQLPSAAFINYPLEFKQNLAPDSKMT